MWIVGMVWLSVPFHYSMNAPNIIIYIWSDRFVSYAIGVSSHIHRHIPSVRPYNLHQGHRLFIRGLKILIQKRKPCILAYMCACVKVRTVNIPLTLDQIYIYFTSADRIWHNQCVRVCAGLCRMSFVGMRALCIWFGAGRSLANST